MSAKARRTAAQRRVRAVLARAVAGQSPEDIARTLALPRARVRRDLEHVEAASGPITGDTDLEAALMARNAAVAATRRAKRAEAARHPNIIPNTATVVAAQARSTV